MFSSISGLVRTLESRRAKIKIRYDQIRYGFLATFDSCDKRFYEFCLVPGYQR
jgi:hypothetical protein